MAVIASDSIVDRNLSQSTAIGITLANLKCYYKNENIEGRASYSSASASR